jgi:hypothetical protein
MKSSVTLPHGVSCLHFRRVDGPDTSTQLARNEQNIDHPSSGITISRGNAESNTREIKGNGKNETIYLDLGRETDILTGGALFTGCFEQFHYRRDRVTHHKRNTFQASLSEAKDLSRFLTPATARLQACNPIAHTLEVRNDLLNSSNVSTRVPGGFSTR